MCQCSPRLTFLSTPVPRSRSQLKVCRQIQTDSIHLGLGLPRMVQVTSSPDLPGSTALRESCLQNSLNPKASKASFDSCSHVRGAASKLAMDTMGPDYSQSGCYEWPVPQNEYVRTCASMLGQSLRSWLRLLPFADLKPVFETLDLEHFGRMLNPELSVQLKAELLYQTCRRPEI